MKVLICGSRGWDDWQAIRRRVDELPADAIVIHGGARGADSWAARCAAQSGRHVVTVCALWQQLGKRAGHLRNAAMLKLGPDLVIAFSTTTPPTPGTANMINQATKAGIKVELHTPGRLRVLAPCSYRGM